MDVLLGKRPPAHVSLGSGHNDRHDDKVQQERHKQPHVHILNRVQQIRLLVRPKVRRLGPRHNLLQSPRPRQQPHHERNKPKDAQLRVESTPQLDVERVFSLLHHVLGVG